MSEKKLSGDGGDVLNNFLNQIYFEPVGGRGGCSRDLVKLLTHFRSLAVSHIRVGSSGNYPTRLP
jgi:hypothetical protein